MSDHLIAPHGGTLVNLVAEAERSTELKAAARDWPSWDLTPRQVCDLELLMNGAFSPLTSFLGQSDYESVCSQMRLGDGTIWPIPITLDLPEELAGSAEGGFLALRDPEGVILAVLHVDEVYTPDREAEAQLIFGTADPEHPGVAPLLTRTNPCYVSGRLLGLAPPHHYDFRALRRTPGELRAQFQKLGWTRVVAFQTRNPMHRGAQELALRAARDSGANLLIQPVVGLTRLGDAAHYARIRGDQSLLSTYPADTAVLSLLNLATRAGSQREAVWRAIVGKNHGCAQFMVDRDPSGPDDRVGGSVSGPRDSGELLSKYQEEIGVQMVPLNTTVSVEDQAALRSGPVRSEQGFTVFFTGLSGSGKSTIANVLLVKLLEIGGRQVTILDGDVVRKHLSSELGFSREHRDINVRRIGYVASEITKNGGIAICAPIAPYDQTRKDVRAMIEEGGGFVLVHVATTLEECEARDRKGFYAKARAGIIKEFTGISDPYEEPSDAELVIRTEDLTAEESANEVIRFLARQGYMVRQ